MMKPSETNVRRPSIKGRFGRLGGCRRRAVAGWGLLICMHLTTWGRTAVSQPPVSTAVRASAEFRIMAGNDFGAASKAFGARESLDFIFKRPLTEVRAHSWSSFFANCIMMMGHIDSEHIVVGYYHLLYDTILLTTWSESGGVPRLIGADLRRTSAPEWKDTAGTSVAVPPWIERSAREPIQAVLRQTFAETLALFENHYPPRANSMPVLRPSTHASDVAGWLESHATAVIRSVRATLSEQGPLFNRSLHAVCEALRSGDQASLDRLLPANGKPSTGQLLRIPGSAWERLLPVYALHGTTDSMVILQDPFRPTVMLLFFFNHSSDRRLPAVSTYSLIVMQSGEEGD